MSAYDILKYLVTVPGAERASTLLTLLPTAERQMFRTRNGRVGSNVLVGSRTPSLIIGAHHDIDPRTVEGATDNTAAVAVLADMVLELEKAGFPEGLAICFWDLEEPGNGGLSDGAEAYAYELTERGVRPSLAVVCDVFGLGIPWLSSHSPELQAFLVRRALHPEGFEVPDRPTPPSDDSGLRQGGIESALLTTLPEDGSTALWAAMHTPNDRIELVSEESIDMCQHALMAIVNRYMAADFDMLAERELYHNVEEAELLQPYRSLSFSSRTKTSAPVSDDIDSVLYDLEKDLRENDTDAVEWSGPVTSLSLFGDLDDTLPDFDLDYEDFWCDTCGREVVVSVEGILHHVTEDGEIDQPADDDHKAVCSEIDI